MALLVLTLAQKALETSVMTSEMPGFSSELLWDLRVTQAGSDVSTAAQDTARHIVADSPQQGV
jgi:hypothetical protein